MSGGRFGSIDYPGATFTGATAINPRGDILGRLNRYGEAETEFLEEIRIFPDSLDAYTSLAALYAADGRLADVRGTIQRMVAANPTPEAFLQAVKAADMAPRILAIVFSDSTAYRG